MKEALPMMKWRLEARSTRKSIRAALDVGRRPWPRPSSRCRCWGLGMRPRGPRTRAQAANLAHEVGGGNGGVEVRVQPLGDLRDEFVAEPTSSAPAARACSAALIACGDRRRRGRSYRCRGAGSRCRGPSGPPCGGQRAGGETTSTVASSLGERRWTWPG